MDDFIRKSLCLNVRYLWFFRILYGESGTCRSCSAGFNWSSILLFKSRNCFGVECFFSRLAEPGWSLEGYFAKFEIKIFNPRFELEKLENDQRFLIWRRSRSRDKPRWWIAKLSYSGCSWSNRCWWHKRINSKIKKSMGEDGMGWRLEWWVQIMDKRSNNDIEIKGHRRRYYMDEHRWFNENFFTNLRFQVRPWLFL